MLSIFLHNSDKLTMFKCIFFLIFLITSNLCFSQNPENLKDLLDVSEVADKMIDSEFDTYKKIIKEHNKKIKKGKLSEEECLTENKKILEVIPLDKHDDVITSEVKVKPKVKFYYKVIAPVEDIRNTELDRVDVSALEDDFQEVMKAQGENARNAAIKKMCEGKTMMEKVQYGSALFSMLGGIYNSDMTGGRDDIYSSEDPTKDPNDTQTITIQRQWNALNQDINGGTDFVGIGGVCRHASVAVTDFLNQCGLDTNMSENKNLQQNLGYRTEEGGHATVKVVDPNTGKTYFLNWGELIESETIDPMSNFELPSKSLQDSGMILSIYEGDADGKRTGTIRNSKGTFIARVLGVADDEIDVSTYTYNEVGAVIDLGHKKITYASGKTKEANAFITTKFAKGENINAAGFNNDIWSTGVQLNYERIKTLPNGFVFRGNAQLSGAYFQANESLNLIDLNNSEIRNKQSGYAGALVVGGSVKKNFITEKSFHSIEVGGDLVSEIYTYKTEKEFGEYSNIDGNAYSILRLDTKNQFNKTEINAGVQTTVGFDAYMTGNDGKYNFFTDNTKAYVMVKQDIGPGKITGSYNQIASVEKKFYTGLVGFEGKKNLNLQTGITVMKYNYDDKAVYQVFKVGKEFNTKKLDINVSGSASIPISNPQGYRTPHASATIVIIPKIGKKRK